MSILGIDIGTTSVCGVVLDVDGHNCYASPLDVNIGDEWSRDFLINDEDFYGTYGVSEGETLKLSAKITESDDNPDIGSGSVSHTVTEDDIAEGFEESFDVYVTENGGRNSGQSAHFVVTFEFTPVE